jgi:hypothetical protein
MSLQADRMDRSTHYSCPCGRPVRYRAPSIGRVRARPDRLLRAGRSHAWADHIRAGRLS